MAALFGFQYDNIDELPEYKLPPSEHDSNVPEEVLESVINEILRKRMVS